jgi:hypothetical protein
MSRKNKAIDVFQYVDMTGGPDACWNWKGALSQKGRPYFSLDGKKQLAYRVVYKLVKGSLPDDKMIRHKCDNSQCCNPSHHELGDHQENMNDMKERERHGLPHHTVKAIRKLAAAGVMHKIIAERYGIGRSTVTEIVNRVSYNHVEDE